MTKKKGFLDFISEKLIRQRTVHIDAEAEVLLLSLEEYHVAEVIKEGTELVRGLDYIHPSLLDL